MQIIEMVNDVIKGKTHSRLLVVGVNEDDPKTGCIRYPKKRLDYEDVLDYVSQTNCIIEIVQNDTAGPTMRYSEAVFYNKKLLTNNKNIVNFPFYNSNYMKVFEKKRILILNGLERSRTLIIIMTIVFLL